MPYAYERKKPSPPLNTPDFADTSNDPRFPSVRHAGKIPLDYSKISIHLGEKERVPTSTHKSKAQVLFSTILATLLQGQLVRGYLASPLSLSAGYKILFEPDLHLHLASRSKK